MVNTSSSMQNCTLIKFTLAIAVGFFFLIVLRSLSILSVTSTENLRSTESKYGMLSSQKTLNVVTWNVAAINNNPFEYWITAEGMPEYTELMQKVAQFIGSPETEDIPIGKIFTDEMFEEFIQELNAVNIVGVEELRTIWTSNYRNRKIISEFIKDSLLGKKRLISMPDRITNTIQLGGTSVMRPTVINCYDKKLDSVGDWWKLWKEFFFHTTFPSTEKKSTSIYQLIPRIDRGKYPAITLDEEKISIPLSLLSLAIFDSILVHMMTTLAKPTWQSIRQEICAKCNFQKGARTLEILTTTYREADIIFLQEVGGDFFHQLPKNHPVFSLFDVKESALMDRKRDQNSFILLKKDRFLMIQEVTEPIVQLVQSFAKANQKKAAVVAGDLMAITVLDQKDHEKYLLASFHGDTNGLATIPMVNATHYYAVHSQSSARLLFGLDANTYTKPEKDQQGVEAFAGFYRTLHLNSCYGPSPNPYNFTTFHARSHLQPQLNKAVTYEERHAKGDRNPKDFVLFFESDFEVLQTWKDNTGERKFVENMVFPTLTFPSDHGITSTLLLEHSRT